ncbi:MULTISPECIES: universal stress protein [Bacillaceae]|uniref:Universal stress protein n=1 Tax=Evansella alkalicola TaxID=745819 RepID=A0ABS6JSF6_9BACI|nr:MULTISPECIES: universal stress protein [Bacillaceae]MBU9721428.1 universal stress protein [Bacillus alkalicola]
MYKNILLAADGSNHSIRAMERAIYIAKKTKEAIITFIHVVDDIPGRKEIIDDVKVREVPEELKIKTAEIEKTISQEGLSIKAIHIYGDPGPTIVREANNGEYDIVIIGSRGLNPLQQMVLGSVSHKVAKRVNCPVLIVK